MKKIGTILIILAFIAAGLIGWFSLKPNGDGGVDLSVTALEWNADSEVKPGTALTFSVTLKNEGSVKIKTPFTVTFGTATETFATVDVDKKIAAGKEITITAAPWTAVAGDYMVAVQVDTTNVIEELSETNNTKQTNLRVADDKLSSDFEEMKALLEKGGITNLIFNDDFNSIDTIDTTDSAKAGYKWYVDRPYGASTLTTEDYTVKDGILTLHNVVPTYNFGLCTYHTDKQVGFTYNMGYMEIRLRIPRPRPNTEDEKGSPAIWALPDTRLVETTPHWVELDWMEYWGDGFYTVTLHDQFNDPRGWYKNSNHSLHGLDDGEWHTMGWLWQNGTFITYLDNTEVMRLTYADGETPDPPNTIAEGESRLGIFSHMDTQMMPIIIGASKANPMELDYVRVWNGGDNTYRPDKLERQEMSASDFLYEYTEDLDGAPIITVTQDNYDLILNGEKEWQKMSEGTKKVINGALEMRGQATYLELLKQAREIRDNLK